MENEQNVAQYVPIWEPGPESKAMDPLVAFYLRQHPVVDPDAIVFWVMVILGALGLFFANMGYGMQP